MLKGEEMRRYQVYQVDSFTREKFHGNPAGVVPEADGLTDGEMQQIARELNNSETAFVFHAEGPDHDVKVRFFTPLTEVPLCGHATVAAHYVRAVEKMAVPGRVIQKTKAGILPVDVTEKDGDFLVTMTQGTPWVGEPFPEETVKQIADALGIRVSDLREDCPVCAASAGNGKIMIGIKEKELLHSLAPDMEKLKRISKETGWSGFYVFTLDPGMDPLVHGRMFGPAVGVNEDPVTGNANGPLGAYLVHYGLCCDPEKQDEFRFRIRQGEAIKRNGEMEVRVEIKNGQPALIQITGQAVIAFKTEITLFQRTIIPGM